jgi:hypothetical protein
MVQVGSQNYRNMWKVPSTVFYTTEDFIHLSFYCWGGKRSRYRRTGYAGVMKSSEAWMKEDESRFDPDRKNPNSTIRVWSSS